MIKYEWWCVPEGKKLPEGLGHTDVHVRIGGKEYFALYSSVKEVEEAANREGFFAVDSIIILPELTTEKIKKSLDTLVGSNDFDEIFEEIN